MIWVLQIGEQIKASTTLLGLVEDAGVSYRTLQRHIDLYGEYNKEGVRVRRCVLVRRKKIKKE